MIPLAANASPSPDIAEPAAGETSDIIVRGQRTGYATEETRSATRTDTRVLDIPQALTAVSKQQIDDRAFRSIADLLRAVPG
ncbi:MAG: TonB-dependent siderophore receptor, partial [Sphingomonas sp.]|nr:TonB-dependent siderophore receptor [Sphingomonas sp.]